MDMDIPPYWTDLEPTLFRSDPAAMDLDEGAFNAPRITVTATLEGVEDGAQIEYLAARPADYRASYNGSGLPFANPEMAYDETPNHGVATVLDGQVRIELFLPNSFYVDLGRTLLVPHVLLRARGSSHYHIVPVANPIPHRSLTHLPDNYPRAYNHPQRFLRAAEADDLVRMPFGLYPEDA